MGRPAGAGAVPHPRLKPPGFLVASISGAAILLHRHVLRTREAIAAAV